MRIRRTLATAFTIAAAFAGASRAATLQWSSTPVSDRWSNGANWVGGIPPTDGDDIVLTRNPISYVNDLPAGTVLRSMTLGLGTTLTGNLLGVSGGVLGANTTYDLPVVFTADQLLKCPALPCGTLTFKQAVDIQTHTVSFQGPAVVVNGPLSGSGTLLTGGTFELNGSHSFAGKIIGRPVNLWAVTAPATAVQSTLDISGSGTVGALTMTGGTLSIRSRNNEDTQILNTGDLSVAGTLRFDLNGASPQTGYDQVRVKGAILLNNPSLSINIGTSFIPVIGQSFVLIDNDGADPVTGTFAQSAISVVANVRYDFAIDYHGGDGNDVVMTCIGGPKVWTGAVNQQWSLDGNWAGGAPHSGDDIAFTGSSAVPLVNDLSADTVVHTVLLAGYTVQGNTLGVSGGMISGGVIGNGMTFANPIQLWANQTLTCSGVSCGTNFAGGLDLQTFAFSTTADTSMTGVAGTGSLTSPQFRTLTMYGHNSYSGIVHADGLILNGVDAPAATIQASKVAASGNVGNVTVSSGSLSIATSSFDSAARTLNTGNLRMGGVLTIKVIQVSTGVTFDRINVTGTVDLTGSALVVEPSAVLAPVIGQPLTVVDNDGADPIVGTFAGLPEGSTVTTASAIGQRWQFRVSYLGGTGNDVTLTALTGFVGTTTTLSISPSQTTYGQAVTLTASVSSASGTPAGGVTFLNGTKTIGTAGTVGGTASLTSSSLAAGPYSIVAVYSGNSTYATSASSPLSFTVMKQSTGTHLFPLTSQESPTQITTNFSVTIDKQIASPVAPSGSVSLYRDGALLATATVVAGRAQIALPGFDPGTYAMQAVYSGDLNYEGSTGPFLHVVKPRPVAADREFTVTEATLLSMTLGSVNPDGSVNRVSIVRAPAHGGLGWGGIDADYRSIDGFIGTDSFTYTLFNGSSISTIGTVTITVKPANTPPAAQPQSVTLDEDASLAIVLTATDADGDVLSYTVVSQPANGMLSGTPPNLTYTPNPNFNGPDSFSFVASDASTTSDPATVAITVQAANDAPTAVDQTVEVLRGTPTPITLAASDVDGDALTFTITRQPARGQLTGQPPNVVYTAKSDAPGTDSFSFVVRDGITTSEPATAALNIVKLKQRPTISIGDIAVREDAGVATFQLRLSASSTAILTIDYATGGGNATDGADYVAKSGTLTFAPGTMTQTIQVRILDDKIAEKEEFFRIFLNNANAEIERGAPATCTIVDDDR